MDDTPLKLLSDRHRLAGASPHTLFLGLVAQPESLWDYVPVGIYMCDRDGRIVSFNRKAVELWGRAPATGGAAERFCGCHRVYDLSGAVIAPADCPMAKVLKTGVPCHGAEAVVERPDGTRFTALVNINPLHGPDGTVVGAINCFLDVTALRRAEAEAAQSRSLLEDFFEKAAVPMHVVDKNGIIVRANRAELALLGYEPDEYIGCHIATFHDSADTINDILRCLGEGEQLDKYPARLRAKDGSIRDVLISSNAEFQDGQFLYTRCVTVDVTEQRRAEAELQQNERRLRTILDALPVALYTTDPHGRITYFNQAAADLAGRVPALGSDQWCVTWRLFHLDGRPMRHDECPMAMALQEQRPVFGHEAYAQRPDGSRVRFTPYPTPLFDAEGRMTGAVNLLVDVTQQRAESEARRNLAAIVESADDAIFSHRLDGTILSWNAAAERIYGYAADEIVGFHISRLIPDERRTEDLELIARVCRGERVEHVETRRRRKDGTLFDVSLTISPVRNSEGNIIGVSKIARDVTQRKRDEERVRLLAREVDHRAHNLLATILAILRLTGSDTLDGFRTDVTARITALAGAHRLFTEKPDGRTELKQLVALQFAPYGAQGKSRIQLDGPDLSVSARTAQGLALVLHELTTNAAKYGALSKPEGTVEMSWTRGTGARVTLRWVERGGPPTRPPTRKGFGTNLIQAVVETDLQGTVDFDWRGEGLVCTLTFCCAEE